MMQTSRQEAVLAMREQQLGNAGRRTLFANNTGSSISAADATAYVYVTSGLNLHAPTGVTVVIATKIERALLPELVAEVPLRPLDIVAFIRRVFGLNASEAALVFRVQRPTIYLWQNLQDMGPVRQSNQIRMKSLYVLAKKWEQLGPLPIGSLGALLPESGSTLLDLLSADIINSNKILQAHDRLATMGDTFRRQEHEKAVEAVHNLKGAFSAMAANQSDRRKSRS
jgi:hypothetical protein